MKIIFLIACIITGFVTSKECECISKICYKKAALLEGFIYGGQMAMDWTTNTLYLFFQNPNFKHFTSAINLDNFSYSSLPMNFTYARAVDQRTHDLYMSGPKGLYKYQDGKVELVGLSNTSIYYMQYTNKLYYTVFNENSVNVYENNQSRPIHALNYPVFQFIIDRYDDIYFLKQNDFSTYRLKKGQSEVTEFSEIALIMSTDKFGYAYFQDPLTSNFYKLDYDADILVKIGKLDVADPFQFTFDKNNNIIYTDRENNLVYLTSSGEKCSKH